MVLSQKSSRSGVQVSSGLSRSGSLLGSLRGFFNSFQLWGCVDCSRCGTRLGVVSSCVCVLVGAWSSGSICDDLDLDLSWWSKLAGLVDEVAFFDESAEVGTHRVRTYLPAVFFH